MKRLLHPNILFPAVFGFLSGIFVNIVTEFVLAGGQTAVYIFSSIFAISLLVVSIYWSRAHPLVPLFRPPIPLRSPLDRERYARRGLIAIVSLFTPDRNSPASQLAPAERVAVADAGDYQALHLPQSNYAPLIKAVSSHSKNLDYCWLISTRSADGDLERSSRTYVPALVNFLRTRVKPTCQFFGHEDDRYVVFLQDDILVASQINEIVQNIYRQAPALGLAEKEMVADITGGFRSIPLGMILACLDPDRTIQFVGTSYNAEGRPEGELFPILFTFEVGVKA